MTETKTAVSPRTIRGVVLVLAYIALFLLTRLTHITTFPLYIDETTHLYVAQLTLNGQLFIGLSETAKQLYVWLVAAFFHLFADPILAGRMVSVMAGLLNAAVCYTLAERLYPKRQLGSLAALFYLVSPFAILFDRLALADSLLATLMGASIILSHHLWRRPTLGWAMALGGMLALATLNKAYAVFYYPTPILFWLVMERPVEWPKAVKLLTVSYAIAAISWLMILFIGQFAYQDYLLKKSIVGSSDLDFLSRVDHFSWLMAEWLWVYLTAPIVALLAYAAIRLIWQRDRYGLVLLILTVTPLVGFALAFTDLYSRYLLPIIIPISVMVAWAIHDVVTIVVSFVQARLDFGNQFPLNTRRATSPPPVGRGLGGGQMWPNQSTHLNSLILLILCLPAISFSYQLLTRPDRAPLHPLDKASYVTHAQSAQGYAPLANYMAELTRQHGQLNFLRSDLPSPLEVILTVYLPERVKERMQLVSVGSYEQLTPPALNALAEQAPILTRESQLIRTAMQDFGPLAAAQLWPIAHFSTSGQESDLTVYQWLLPPDFALRWLTQGGNDWPIVAGTRPIGPITAEYGQMVAWPQPDSAESMARALKAAHVEYILATPELIAQDAALFAPFVTTDGETLALKQLPPDWRLAYAYPNLNCEWCLFQLRPPSVAYQATFAQTLAFEGYDLSAQTISTGEALQVTLYWHSLQPLAEPTTIFIHLLDPNGGLIAQVDGPPMQGLWPMTQWPLHTRLADRHTLSLPSDLPAGTYRLIMGLYSPTTLERVSAEANQHEVENGAVHLTTIEVQARK